MANSWIIFNVAGSRLKVPRHWWARMVGPLPPEGFVCDGCSWSPDAWRGYELWPACVVHDYHYRTGVLGGTWRARQAADAALRHNLRALVRLQGGSRARAESLAWLYWGRVRIWGRGAYRGWSDPGAERPLWRRILEAWGILG